MHLALEFFEKNYKFSKELYEKNPENLRSKNALAISYSHLGDVHSNRRKLDKALDYFVESNRIVKELCSDQPKSDECLFGLTSTNSRIGNIYIKLACQNQISKNKLVYLNQALKSFQDANRVAIDLYENDRKNVQNKNCLAITYSKLGETYIELQNFKQALINFENRYKLSRELCATNPKNITLLSNLANSYEGLGYSHLMLDNLPQALELFEKRYHLCNDLFFRNPDNIEFKINSTSSIKFLGLLHQKSRIQTQSEEYYMRSKKLFETILTRFPQKLNHTYLIEFKNYLNWINVKLVEIKKSEK